MITVSLADDAPLGPNDLRVKIDDELLAKVQAEAKAQGIAWEDLVIRALNVSGASSTSATGVA